MAKSLYSTLFAWLVQRINTIVAERLEGTKVNSIAILDIFGFEVSLSDFVLQLQDVFPKVAHS